MDSSVLHLKYSYKPIISSVVTELEFLWTLGSAFGNNAVASEF